MTSPRRPVWLLWFAVAGAVVAALVLAARPAPEDRSPAARAHRISARLRCPVCQGLSVADSPSSTARAIRDDVRRRVEAGESDGRVLQDYVDRYGQWILLAPSSRGLGAVVWALPAGVLVVAAGGLVLAFLRWRRDPPMHATPADHELVTRALHERRPGPR